MRHEREYDLLWDDADDGRLYILCIVYIAHKVCVTANKHNGKQGWESYSVEKTF